MSKADDIFLSGEHAVKLRDYAKELEVQWEEHLSAMKHDAYWQAQEHLLEEARGRIDAYQRRVDELVEELRAASEHTALLRDRIWELEAKLSAQIVADCVRDDDAIVRAPRTCGQCRWTRPYTPTKMFCYAAGPICEWDRNTVQTTTDATDCPCFKPKETNAHAHRVAVRIGKLERDVDELKGRGTWTMGR